ncbi:c6 zinc finger domain protein [Fusarium sp. NRRL 25303]|nr:c6 zinc finger domain protein [Fusarium sp. NRRL 25303]
MSSPPQSPRRVSQRQPKACLECTRRKTRCDKAIPCGRCVRLSKPCSREVVRVRKIERNHRSELTFLHELSEILKASGDVESALAAIRERKSLLLQGASPSTIDNSPTSSSARIEHDGLPRDEAASSAISPEALPESVQPLGEGTWEHDSDITPDSPLTQSRDSRRHQHAVDFLRIELLAWGFHLDNILWHHNVFHAPTFLSQCEHFWTTGTVMHSLWLSLYYAVTSVSAWTALNCVCLWTDPTFDRDLPQQLFRAMVDQLYQEDFAENHSIFSIQAIVLSTRVAHNLGRSDWNATLLGAAIRMAHCMGLHNIRNTTENPAATTEEGWFQCIETEVGRRCWNQLVIQDYFQVPFTETYAINPSQFTTELPINCHDEDMISQNETVLTINSYPRVLVRMALLMPKLLDSLSSALPRRSLAETYKVVASSYSALHDIVRHLPPYFTQTPPPQSGTGEYMPAWLPFARRSLALSAADKVIMIHRPVLYHAFQVPALIKARKSCVAAAKTIFKEYESISQEGVIPIWTHSAFCVTATIVIGLELLFREAHTDDEASSLRSIMNRTAQSLQSRQSDIIAARCAALIETILLVEEELVVSLMRLSFDGSTAQLRSAQIGIINRMVGGNEIMAKFLAYRPSNIDFGRVQSESWYTDNNFVMDLLQDDRFITNMAENGFGYPGDGDFAFMYAT